MTSATTVPHGYHINMLQQLIGETLPFEYNKGKGKQTIQRENGRNSVACLLIDPQPVKLEDNY